MYSDYQNKLMENVKIPHLTILTFDFKSLLVRVVKLGYDILDVFIKSNPDFEVSIQYFGNHYSTTRFYHVLILK